MAEVIPDESIVSWAAEVAARLRLLQAGCADDGPAMRREEILKIIQRALERLPAAKRRPSLEFLAQRFPSAVAPGSTAKPEPKVTLDKVLSDARKLPAADKEALGERLVADGTVKPAAPVGRQSTWATFEAAPEQERAEFLRRLIERGAIELGPTESSSSLSEELRKLLGLPEGQAAPVGMLEKLLFLLLRVKFDLDKILWLNWENLAPAGPIRKPLDFERLVRDTLSDPDPAAADQRRERMASYLTSAKELASTMLTAVGPACLNYGKWFGQTLSPTAIKQAVPRGLLRGESYWDKYQQLYEANVNSPEMIRKRILDFYVKLIEKTIRNASRKPLCMFIGTKASFSNRITSNSCS